MRHEEYIKSSIQAGRTYENLPERVRALLPLATWKAMAREQCVRQGLAWDSSVARDAAPEQAYYEELVAAYRAWGRLYPYHLAHFVARVMRVTPFRYYSDLLFAYLKEERSYDRIPNFTAADALRLTGVGRNEYIALLNACKAKKLLWRVNKGIARDLLPAVPRDVRMEPWWRVGVVNVGETEFRELPAPEAALLRAACGPGMVPLVAAFDQTLLQALYRRGLIWLEVPVAAEDKFSVPPLEGFVSNKTSEAGDESVDPLEPLLYSLFLANSTRVDQRQLADILGADLASLLLATSIAVRLGFATRLPASGEPGTPLGHAGSGLSSASGLAGSQGGLSIPEPDAAAAGAAAGAAPPLGSRLAAADSGDELAGAWGGSSRGAGEQPGGAGAGVAVVVDAEVTSSLMMGAFSPGLKRHSVTLFEGGRVGPDALDELIAELAASAAFAEAFEGAGMVQLVRVVQSLAALLAAVRSAAASQGRQLELLRIEPLAGLDPLRAAKVLSHAYAIVLPIAPMPGPPLPLTPCAPSGPACYGPSPEADSPWLQLALYAAARAGPISLACPAGQRFGRLPGALQGCSHALLWGWKAGGGGSGGAAAAAGPGSDGQPLLVEGCSLLATLNELLTRTAVLVQPLVFARQLAAFSAADEGCHLVAFADVALPLQPAAAAGAGGAPDAPGASPLLQQQQAGSCEQAQGLVVQAVARSGAAAGQARELLLPGSIVAALQQLQLSGAVGWLRVVRLPAPALPAGGTPQQKQPWLPLSVSLGAPVFCPTLCQQGCDAMLAAGSLEPEACSAWRGAQRALQAQLDLLVCCYGPAAGCSSELVEQQLQQPPQQQQQQQQEQQEPEPPSGSDSSRQGSRGSGLAQLGSPAAAAPAWEARLAAGGGVELPACGLLFDGASLMRLDLSDCLQGGAALW